MNERELPEEAQQIVNSNGELLRDGQFSDENARAGYYDIARGATPELENGLFNCLISIVHMLLR